MRALSGIRTFIIWFIVTIAYVILLIHLYFLQIHKHDFFKNLADQQYSISLKHNPARALIIDRHQQPLALNKESIAAFITPRIIQSKEMLEKFLKEYFPNALERLQKNPQAQFLYVKRRLSAQQIELINKANISDIKYLKEQNRFYPNATIGHIIGVTNIENHGLFGIELLYNTQLEGKAGLVTLQKDARSGYFHFNKETKTAEQPGNPITLTIDSTLQFLVAEELKQTVEKFKAHEGAVLIMDPANGQIIVMAQYPIFDPNNTETLEMEYTKNKIATESYEFGSVIKIFLALAALEEKVVSPDEFIHCQNTKVGYVNGVKISTWPHGHGLITFQEIIQYSNNIGVAQVALRLGPKLYEHYRRMGFGTKTTLNWPGEQKGFVNPPNKWTKPSIISLSFGYEITATLLQLCSAFCTIANNGIPVTPHIIMQETSSPATQKPLYSQKTIDEINSILEKTVKEGTAHKASIKGYKVRGKTGTANMVIDGHYNTDHNIYTFVGIIQKDHYQRVIATFVKDIPDKKLYASSVTVPLFEAVAERVLIHDHQII